MEERLNIRQFGCFGASHSRQESSERIGDEKYPLNSDSTKLLRHDHIMANGAAPKKQDNF